MEVGKSEVKFECFLFFFYFKFFVTGYKVSEG